MINSARLLSHEPRTPYIKTVSQNLVMCVLTILFLTSCTGSGNGFGELSSSSLKFHSVSEKAVVTLLDATSVYSLEVENSQLNLGLNVTSGKLVQNPSASSDLTQQFSMVASGTNLYQLVNTANGKCLSADGSATDIWSGFSTQACNIKQASQTFLLKVQSDSSFVIQPYSGQSGMCLDVENASTSANQPIIQYPCNYTTNERIQFTVVNQVSSAPSPSSATDLSFGATCAAGATCNYAGAAEDSQVAVSCASGVMTVSAANYGAKSSNESCLSYSQSSCQGQASCQLTFSNASCGGDPIYGTVKTGFMTVTCSQPLAAPIPTPTAVPTAIPTAIPNPTPAPVASGQAFGSACTSSSCSYSGASENATVSASCSAGVINVNSAIYGAGSVTESCLVYAQHVCNGLASCSPNFNNSTCGGDPQYGVMKNAAMTIQCAQAAAPPIPTPTLAPTATPAPISTQKTYRVLPLGDSITAGIGSTSGNGYRRLLYNSLTSGNYAITMVGAHNAGDPVNANEGNPGWTIRMVDSSIIEQNNEIATYTPDAVIIMLGTNDIEYSNDVANAPSRTCINGK